MVWAVSLSTTELIPRSLTPVLWSRGIRSLVGVGSLVGPLAHSVLYLRYLKLQGYTKIYFGENQLFPGLIGLSPLFTAHPSGFQPTPVRAFTHCYMRFTLTMDRSLGFGSTPCNSNALFRLAFATAPPDGLTLLHRVTR